MTFIDARPKVIYIGRDCSDKHADCLFDIADEHAAKIYKMGFNDYLDNYELVYKEFKKKNLQSLSPYWDRHRL